MPGNAKTNPDYELRLNQEDCTTVELKQTTADSWTKGGMLKPYGPPFEGYDAFSFQLSEGYEAEKYDAKVGTCTCD